jgi:hypothetical protein
VFDDTDRGTLANLPYVYDFLRELGFRTTKSVWPIAGDEPPAIVGGSTCAEPAYADFVRRLQASGFEVGFHCATFHSSRRVDTFRALERFTELFGHAPRSMATHTTCKEGLYWGAERLSGTRRLLYRVLTGRLHGREFTGHVPGSDYFWGDLCRERIEYVRNFVFSDINTLKVCPFMPYHDPARPYVNQWYASTNGANVHRFNDALREEAQEQLLEEGGACVMYTHFGKGFYVDGRMNPRFVRLMERLAGQAGWFPPVSELLDHLRAQRGEHLLTDVERVHLERRWLLDSLKESTWPVRHELVRRLV